MQTAILENIKNRYDLNDVTLAQRVNSLKPISINLWKSYRNTSININYEDKLVQESYLFRYYSLYYSVAKLFLKNESIYKTITAKEKLRILFLGAGPAPEIAAFIDLLKNGFYGTKFKSIYIHDIDRYGNTWKYSRDLHALPLFNQLKGQLNSMNIDTEWYSSTKLFDFEKKLSNKYDIIYSQNFFNEIIKGTNSFGFNDFLKNNLLFGGLFVSSERVGYPNVESFFSKALEKNQTLNSVLYKKEVINKDLFSLDPILKDELFTGGIGLIATRNARSTQRIINFAEQAN